MGGFSFFIILLKYFVKTIAIFCNACYNKSIEKGKTLPKGTHREEIKEMKNYKENAISLGASDIASLTVMSATGVNALNFGTDGSYRAYIIDDTVAVPAHYTLTLSLNHWAKIYDDEGLVANFRAERINIYRAGEMGCIIQLIDKRD